MLRDTLLVVDVQNDFCPGGALPVPRGDEVVEKINGVMKLFDVVMASRDWHPVRTVHFKEYGGVWPPHCIQESRGAEFHPELNTRRFNHIISKGMENSDDGYSAFEGRCLQGELDADLWSLLRDWGVEKLYVCGLATDYCVKATVLDALRLGFTVVVFIDACRAVDVNPGDGERALREMRDAGAVTQTTDELLNFVV